MRKIQSKEGALEKARENTAPIEVQQAVEDTQEPVPAEDSSADGNTNEVCTFGEVEAPTGAMAGDKLCQVVVPDGVSEGDLFRVKLTPEVQHMLSHSDVEDTQKLAEGSTDEDSSDEDSFDEDSSDGDTQ